MKTIREPSLKSSRGVRVTLTCYTVFIREVMPNNKLITLHILRQLSLFGSSSQETLKSLSIGAKKKTKKL